MPHESNGQNNPTRIERSLFEKMRQDQEDAIARDRAERARVEQNQRDWERGERDRAERERDRWRRP